MDKEAKEKFVADAHGRLEKADGVFIVDYKGLNVEATNRLRNELRKVNAEFQVTKNRLLKLACQDTDTEVIVDYMKGPTAIAIAHDDLVGSAKVLVDFSNDFKQLEIKYGQMSGKVVDKEAIKKLAELPGKDILLAQVLSGMQAVPVAFVRTLNGVIINMLNVLKAIEQQKAE